MKQVNTFLEYTMTGDKGVRVAGYIKDLHRAIRGSQALREYAPVYSGHHDVRDEKMNRSGVLRSHALSFRPVRGCQDVIPVFLQKQPRQQPQRLGVFDQ